MLESALALGIAHVMKKERFVERMDPAAKPADKPADKPATKPAAKPDEKKPEDADPKTIALGFLFMFLNFVFNLWISSIAYKCNGNSLLWGLFGFFAPVFYLIIHAFHWFRCDKFVPAMTGGAKRFRVKRK
jgi:hypothetical protein